jgi:hypothetical protein
MNEVTSMYRIVHAALPFRLSCRLCITRFGHKILLSRNIDTSRAEYLRVAFPLGLFSGASTQIPGISRNMA